MYYLGDEITCQMDITNIGSNGYYLLIWKIPLKEIRADIFKVSRDGKVIPYDGIFVKRGRPGAANFMLIPVGDTLSVTFDLSEAYSIGVNGRYTVELDTVIEYYPTNEYVNKRYKKILKSLPVTFQVVGYETPRLTKGEKAREEEERSLVNQPSQKVVAASGPLAPKCKQGFDPAEAKICVKIHKETYGYVSRSIKAVDNQPTLYQEWFGDPGNGRRKIVRTNYIRIRKVMKTEKITYVNNGPECEPGDFAYTHDNTRTIHYCEEFWKSKNTYPPHDSKICTCVHELTHAVCSTEDHEYTPAKCKKLAKDHPKKAVDNADNYGYFSEVLKP